MTVKSSENINNKLQKTHTRTSRRRRRPANKQTLQIGAELPRAS